MQVIGRVNSVTSAARELCTSQPAVTHAVANLEAEIGAPIFERSATGSYPTPIGRQYLLRVDRFFETLDTAIAHVLGWHADTTGRPKPQIERLVTGTQLRALIVTSEPECVDEIANGLGLSPDSLFRSARSLERALGTPLFDRTARGMIPNPTGEMLAREFRRSVREIELARSEVLLASGTTGGLEIVVGAPAMAGSRELAAATCRFMAAHPKVRVRLVPGEYRRLIAHLLNSRIDMIFGVVHRSGAACRSDQIDEETLSSDGYCMVARPGHPLAGLDRVTPDDLVDYPWVVPSVGTARRNRIEALFSGCATRPNFHLETSSLTLSRALVVASNTLTIMMRSEIQHDFDDGGLVQLRYPVLDDVLMKGVTTNRGWLPTRPHTEFVDCLRKTTSPGPIALHERETGEVS